MDPVAEGEAGTASRGMGPAGGGGVRGPGFGGTRAEARASFGSIGPKPTGDGAATGRMVLAAMTARDRIPQVLVVDDEPNNREVVQVALEFHGRAVSMADNGPDAVQRVAERLPDL